MAHGVDDLIRDVSLSSCVALYPHSRGDVRPRAVVMSLCAVQHSVECPPRQVERCDRLNRPREPREGVRGTVRAFKATRTRSTPPTSLSLMGQDNRLTRPHVMVSMTQTETPLLEAVHRAIRRVRLRHSLQAARHPLLGCSLCCSTTKQTRCCCCCHDSLTAAVTSVVYYQLTNDLHVLFSSLLLLFPLSLLLLPFPSASGQHSASFCDLSLLSVQQHRQCGG